MTFFRNTNARNLTSLYGVGCVRFIYNWALNFNKTLYA